MTISFFNTTINYFDWMITWAVVTLLPAILTNSPYNGRGSSGLIMMSVKTSVSLASQEARGRSLNSQEV